LGESVVDDRELGPGDLREVEEDADVRSTVVVTVWCAAPATSQHPADGGTGLWERK
jgi:hypothetical protein